MAGSTSGPELEGSGPFSFGPALPATIASGAGVERVASVAILKVELTERKSLRAAA